VAAGSVVQIGALTIATYAVELLLERGFVFALGTLLYQFMQGTNVNLRMCICPTTMLHLFVHGAASSQAARALVRMSLHLPHR